ncbi:MAG: cytidine deaminase [Gemmatimonadetes bacterium]|nr:cytidine deaminase [Gemmatimonadota bacterium]
MKDRLVQAATEAQANAYAPYSGFKVGAALQDTEGRIFVGANVENASFGVTNCAERVALGAAIAAGARKFDRLVVVSEATPPSAPCGACRQVLSEMAADLVVEAVGPSGSRRWLMGDLMPDPFGAEDLAP